jgi:hypothetical protein
MTPKEKKSTLTAEWLREHMAYVPETGTFMWKVRGAGRTVGKVLGTVNSLGYAQIKVNNVVYYAHRLAWFYVNGEWPEGHLDHIDMDKTNNAIANLRRATPSQNAAGRKTYARIAPSRGVFPHGAGFVARIHHSGERHYLGYFPTLEAAKAAYEAKARELHGEFAYQDRVSKADAEVAAAVKRNPNRDWLLVATPGFGA